MTKIKRVLLISCSVVLLCTAIITGMTYALFTDSVSVKNHLQAGTLDLVLTRTNLKYKVLDENGYLKETPVEADLPLTGPVGENAFGINSKDIRIVPGSYFDAELEIKHGPTSNVAFTYSVGIKLVGENTDLVKQLWVTVTKADGTVVASKSLDKFVNGLTVLAGEIEEGGAPEKFNVKVEFLDEAVLNSRLEAGETVKINNNAQNDVAVFDLVVSATQATR